jgi:hypothetical protein
MRVASEGEIAIEMDLDLTRARQGVIQRGNGSLGAEGK